jgi:hypothetical protein
LRDRKIPAGYVFADVGRRAPETHDGFQSRSPLSISAKEFLTSATSMCGGAIGIGYDAEIR